MAAPAVKDYSRASAGRQLDGTNIIEFKDFEGMATQYDRHALPDNKLAWCENLQPIGKNELLAVGIPATTLTVLVGETITRQFSEVVNGINYLICFCVSGSAYAVNLTTGAQIHFAPASTFSLAPDVTNWNGTRILITDATAGYCTWDGTIFIKSGNVSPNFVIKNGGMYTTAPTVTLTTVQGSGSGATATAVLTNGVVTSINLTNAGTGYTVNSLVEVSFSGGTPTAGLVDGAIILNGGAGYQSAPTVTVTSSTGTGATATATIANGVVTAITITAEGHGYQDAAFSFSGGSPTTAVIAFPEVTTLAAATVNIWPFITPNNITIAVFQGRVFLAQAKALTYTGTQGYDDFNPVNASGTFTISDTDLINSVTALRSLNNYLYIIGDNSIKQIGNLTVTTPTTGNGVTQFTVVTLSSDQGTTFQGSIISYNRLLLFANTVGVYAVYGSSVEKISDDMDGIFRLIDFSQEPVAAVNDINNIHVFMLLVRYKDPTSSTRSLLLSFMNKKWFVISQGNSVSYMTTVVINSVTQTYGTSGNDITQLLENYAAPVSFLLKTPLSAHNKAWLSKTLWAYAIAQTALIGTPITLTLESERGGTEIEYTPDGAIIEFYGTGPIQFVNSTGENIYFSGGDGFFYQTSQATNVGAAGVYLGCTLQGDVANFSVQSIMLAYDDGPLFGSQR